MAGEHAGAAATIIGTVQCVEDGLRISVIDDGADFDRAAGSTGHGFGSNVRERRGAVGGTLGSGATMSGTTSASR